jgi:hypothetical protein
MIRTYTHRFTHNAGAWTCTFTIGLTGTEMEWTPECPQESAPIWYEYHSWRDQCLADFARHTGVLHQIILDVPWAGLRLRAPQAPTERSATYAWAAEHHAELRSAACSGSPTARAQLFEDFGALMLAAAPADRVQ